MSDETETVGYREENNVSEKPSCQPRKNWKKT